MESEIKRILIVYNPYKENVFKLINKIKSKLENKNIRVFTEKEPEKLKGKKFDLILTFGGDGTLLKAVHYFPDSYYLGIHMGRVGFLCEINKNELDKAIDKILKKDFEIYERDTIGLKFSKKEFWALNDILIRNEPAGRVMEFDLIIDNVKFYYIADGVLFSTPTGSTAYNFALNGPVLHHDLNGFCVNVIAPFNVNARPFVIPAGKKVCLLPKGKTGRIKIWLDGQREIELRKFLKMEFFSGSKKIKFISLKNKGKNIYKRLKEKFGF